jgi:NAD(P)-dependent dehydrogenase (short-subunit alcohol dehydrogenase family)
MTRYPAPVATYHHAPYPGISASAQGEVVLVTGGGKGIGKAIATRFAAAGARAVIILGGTGLALQNKKSEIENQNPGVLVQPYTADVPEPLEMRRILEDVIANFGSLDVLVLNAGFLCHHLPVADSQLDDYWHNFEVNVKGVVVVLQQFLRVATAAGLPESGNLPSLINVSSGTGHIRHIPGYSGYAASKLAQMKIMEYVHFENSWLRVFNINPGAIATDMARKAGNIETEDDIGESKKTSQYSYIPPKIIWLTWSVPKELPAAFCVWLTTSSSEFLRGRMVWANWDVDELKAKEKEIVEKDLLRTDLKGGDTVL